MRRHSNGLIDMTSLLDVVFILLFALIMNVNVSKAEDAQMITKQNQTIQSLEVLITDSEEKVKAQADTLAEELKTSNDMAVALDRAEKQSENRRELLEAYEEALSEVLNRQVKLSQEDISEAWLKNIEEETALVEAWVKYQQIAERYLFVDIRVSGDDGRIYLDESYTGVNITHEVAVNPLDRREAIEALRFFIVDWLDHKEGGYSFVFVTVVEEDSITRAVAQSVFDGLQGIQTMFDKDYYLINRYVKTLN